MEDSNKQDFQRRFLIAIVLSIAVLAGWMYFFPPPKPTPNNNSNTAQTAPAEQNAQQQPAPASPAVPGGAYQLVEIPKESTNKKVITISSPYYEVVFDSRGAVPFSWVLKKHKSSEGERDLNSIASTKDNVVPLELISQQGIP